MIEISRFQNTVSIVASSAAASTSPRFAFTHMAGAGVLIGNTAGATQIDWYGAHGQNETPLAIYADGSAVTTAVTVGAHPVPDACFAFPFVVPVVTGNTTCAMTVCLKG